jgi:hypothetical protein
MARLACHGGGAVSAGLGWRGEGERGSAACGPAQPAGRSMGWAERPNRPAGGWADWAII